MVPGVRYRGYGFINDFKEFQFVPEDTGSRAGREKCIYDREGLKINETKNLLVVKLNIEKADDKAKLISQVAAMFNNLTKFIQKYDI